MLEVCEEEPRALVPRLRETPQLELEDEPEGRCCGLGAFGEARVYIAATVD